MSDQTTCDGCGETSEESYPHICNGDRDRWYRLRIDGPYEAGRSMCSVACLAKVLSALGDGARKGFAISGGLSLGASAVPPRPETWAEVEVLGHRSHVGRVREETLAGVSFLRVDALRADGTFEAVLYSRQAIFSVTPRSEADARRAAVPESLRPCDAFKASGACEGACVHCGYNLGAHDAQRAGTWKRDEEKGDDMPW
jgi:hypothetical protein